MSEQPITLQLEIPPEVNQQELWDFEEQLKQIDGITTDLREPRGPIAEILLLISVAAPYVAQAVTVAGDINTLHDLVQTIYTFLHPKKPNVEPQRGKNEVVIITKGKRIELYNLSSEEIKEVIKSMR